MSLINEMATVDVRRARQLAYEVVNALQMDKKGEQVVAIGIIMNVMDELGLGAHEVMQVSHSVWKQAKEIHKPESKALEMYVDAEMLGN